MAYLKARKVTQLNDLTGHAEGTRNQRLRGNHGGHGGHDDQRQQGPTRCHHEKRVLHGLWVGQQQRSLPEVVQRQRWHGDAEPGQTNRFFAKMPQVGIQRFRTGHAEHHRAQNDEAGAGVVPDEQYGVVRAQTRQNFRVAHDLAYTQQGDTGKPGDRKGTKELANACRTAFLHKKQQKQNHQRQRNHGLGEVRRDDFQSLNRREHRDCRGNHPIAIEQRSTEHAHQKQRTGEARLVFDGLRCQSQHGYQTALAVVVGAQHEHHVFEGDDDRQRPEQYREHAVDVGRRKRHMA